MTEVLHYLGDTLVGALYAVAFAALLIGYLWDFMRFSGRATVIMMLTYCALASAADQLVVLYFGVAVAHRIVYMATIFVLPYIFIYFLTRMPLIKYIYCLSSVSIQVFFITGLLEYFRISNDEVMLLPTGIGLCCGLGLIALNSFILFVFRRFSASVMLEYQDDAIWRKLSALPLSGAIALGGFYFLTNFTVCGISVLIVFILCYIAYFIADVAAMNSIRISIRAATAEARLESADQLMAAQKEQYQRLSDSIAQTRQARHDLRHHMNMIGGFLQADDRQGLLDYLAEYNASIPKSEDYIYTGNYAADIIIGHYLTLARQNEIRVEYELRIPSDCCILDTDLCVLMGNCLENAIDACMKLPPEKRFLRVESIVRHKYLAITVANSYNGDVTEKDGEYLSDKRGRNAAGIGLESVGAVVRAYHGEMKLEDRAGVFTVYIMLRMLEKKQQSYAE